MIWYVLSSYTRSMGGMQAPSATSNGPLWRHESIFSPRSRPLASRTPHRLKRRCVDRHLVVFACTSSCVHIIQASSHPTSALRHKRHHEQSLRIPKHPRPRSNQVGAIQKRQDSRQISRIAGANTPGKSVGSEVSKSEGQHARTPARPSP